jgi:fluoride exporter
MMGYLLVFVGAGLGGVLRHGVNVVTVRLGAEWPWQTLAVNVIGSLAMGLLVASLTAKGDAAASWRLFAATGVLGGFTTFSAFSMDVALLWQRGAGGQALLYVLASVGLSIAAVFAGLWLGRAS